MTEALGAHGAGVWSLSCVYAEVGLEVLQAVEVSVALCAAEGAAARRVKLQSAPLPSSCGRRTTLLVLLLALAGVPPQQAGQVEGLAAELAGVHVADGVAGPHVDSISLWTKLWGQSRFFQLEDGKLRREGGKICGRWKAWGHVWRMSCKKIKKNSILKLQEI